VKPFLYLVIVSALVIAATAALFSVTGIATAFSGHFLQVAIMAGAIEAGKIVVASLLYRNWKTMAWLHKSYLTFALIVLMGITSAGIFGYLSEAYQETKGDYTVIEKQASILQSKKVFFEDRKDRLQNDKQLELKTKISNQMRADSLTSRGQSITRTREDIKESETKIVQLETQISAMEDSIGVYDLRIIDLQSANIKGELGPLTYIAEAFDMPMDDVIKWFILILVFVFDPLAVALIVAANMLYLKKTKGAHEEQPEFTEHFVDKAKKIFNKKEEEKFTGILDDSIFENTIEMIDKSVENFKKGEVSEPIDVDSLLEPESKEPTETKTEPEGGEKKPLDDKKKKEPIIRRWQSANWREPDE